LKSEIRCRVNANGQILIPAAFRKALGIRAGDYLLLRLEDGELRITTLKKKNTQARPHTRKS
jgi:AbrB family looped-hinge helix DNA binding protein